MCYVFFFYAGIADGEIFLNGRNVTQDQMSRISGYVCQKDQTHENLTVLEHLTFTVSILNKI